MFRKIFISTIIPTWLLVVAIACILALPRFYWMLQGNYNAIIVIFLVMMALPFLLLSKFGRSQIGLTKPVSWMRVLVAFCAGSIGAVLVYVLGVALYGTESPLHWYVAVKATITQRGDAVAAVRAAPALFLVFALPPMIFSPLGEELFFRGIFHEAVAERFDTRVALIADAVAFGLTHIAHYGLAVQNGTLTFLFPSVIWWVLQMAAAALLFSFARMYAGTLWAAVLCHAGFNGTMMWCIFFALG
jgi:membrane protease YdiL (CAAX protease family)